MTASELDDETTGREKERRDAWEENRQESNEEGAVKAVC